MTLGTVLLPLALAVSSLGPPADEAIPPPAAVAVHDGQSEARARLGELLRDCRRARQGVELEVRLRRTSAPPLEWGCARVTRLSGVLIVEERATELSTDPVDFVRTEGVCGKRYSFDGSVEVGAGQGGPASALESWLPLALQDGSMLEAPDEVRTLEESLEHWTIEMTSGGDGPTRDATPIRFLLRPVGQPSGLELTLEIERTAGAPRIRRLSAATRRSDAPQIVVPIHDTVAEFDDAAKPYPARLVITVVRSGPDGAPVTQRHVLEIERATSLKPDPDEARRRTRLLLEPAPGAEVTDRRLGLRYRGGDRRFECGGRAYLADVPLGSPLAIRLPELLEKSTRLDPDSARPHGESPRAVDKGGA